MKRSRRPPARFGFEESQPSVKAAKNRERKPRRTKPAPSRVAEERVPSLVGSSCAETYRTICVRYSDRPLVGTLVPAGSSYTWVTYAKFWEQVERFSSCLIQHFAASDSVGICCANRLEWLVADWGCVCAGVTSIPIHTNRALNISVLSAIYKVARFYAVVCERAQLAMFLALDPPLRFVYLLDYNDGDAHFLHTRTNTSTVVLSFSALLESTRLVLPLRPHKPSAISTVIWSSGTTGVPKGAALREATLLQDLADVEADSDDTSQPPVQLAIYSFAYSLERDTFQTIALYGGQMAMFTQPLHRVFTALELLRPTCILGVPALWSALHHEFEQEVTATVLASSTEARTGKHSLATNT